MVLKREDFNRHPEKYYKILKARVKRGKKEGMKRAKGIARNSKFALQRATRTLRSHCETLFYLVDPSYRETPRCVSKLLTNKRRFTRAACRFSCDVIQKLRQAPLLAERVGQEWGEQNFPPGPPMDLNKVEYSGSKFSEVCFAPWNRDVRQPRSPLFCLFSPR